tara:strand:+ start:5174 stop:5329 length:156 start_codon:yes stop_codon:yes gene_type:complete
MPKVWKGYKLIYNTFSTAVIQEFIETKNPTKVGFFVLFKRNLFGFRFIFEK